MWRSKKLIVGVALAAVLLFGSLGGVVLAQENGDDNGDNNQPRVEFLERLAGKLGITVEDLQAKIAEVRGELPEGNPEDWRGKQGSAGRFGNLLEGLDEETKAALKEAMAEARERIQAGEDREVVMADMAGVLASYEIDVDELKAKFAGDADGERPFKRGFIGPRGMRGFGGPCAPTE